MTSSQLSGARPFQAARSPAMAISRGSDAAMPGHPSSAIRTLRQRTNASSAAARRPGADGPGARRTWPRASARQRSSAPGSPAATTTPAAGSPTSSTSRAGPARTPPDPASAPPPADPPGTGRPEAVDRHGQLAWACQASGTDLPDEGEEFVGGVLLRLGDVLGRDPG